ncbi:hypothetical protein Tco_0363916 [Tanacetum coccineum]
MESLIEDENAMDKGIADTVKDHKRKHDDDDDEAPPAGPNQGKTTKRRRTKESESSKKPSTIKETPKGKAPSKGSKTGKSTSAKEPVILDQPEQPWFNHMVFATKDPLTFNDLMATPIDLSNASTLDWNNLEGDRYPFDLSEPLPLQEVTYPTSITKTKAARYEINGIEDMIVVKRSDQQLYKFKEDDFVDLRLEDIEYMFFLAVQHKLFHLDGSDIVDFIVAL